MNAFNFLVPLSGTSLQGSARKAPFDLRELRYFHSVARTGNFSRSAQELNVSQPAISQQLRKLEEGLGTPLLIRHGRGVALTPAGVCLRDRLDTIMQLLAWPLSEPAAAETVPGRLSLALPAESGPLLAAPLVRQFRAHWPDIALEVREGSGTEVEEWVLHRRVDLAVIHDPPALPELEVLPVLTEDLVFVTSVNDPAAQDRLPLRLRDLAHEALILPGSQHWIRRRVDRAAQQHGIHFESVLQVSSVTSTKAMVRNGLGCTILPLAAIQDEVARGALAFRPISHPSLTATCAVAFCHPGWRAFAEMARETITALVDGGALSEPQIIRSEWRRAGPPRECAAEASLARSQARSAAI